MLREYNRLYVGQQGAQAADSYLKGRVLAKPQSHWGSRQSNVERCLEVCYAGGCYPSVTGMQLDGAPRLRSKRQWLDTEHVIKC